MSVSSSCYGSVVVETYVPEPPVEEQDGHSFPRLAAYSIGDWEYDKGAGGDENAAGVTLPEHINIWKKCHIVILGGWRGWSYGGYNQQTIAGTIKAASSISGQLVLKYDDFPNYRVGQGTMTALHPERKCLAETGPYGDWRLRDSSGTPIAIEGFPVAQLINSSSFSTPDVNGYSPAYWKGLFLTADDGDSAQDWATAVSGYGGYNIGLGIKPDYDWDGVWFDNQNWDGYVEIEQGVSSPYNYTNCDVDGNGVADELGGVNQKEMWRYATEQSAEAVRFRYSNFVIGGNCSGNVNPNTDWDVHGESNNVPATTRAAFDVVNTEKLMGVSWSPENWSGWPMMMRYYKNIMALSTRPNNKAVFHISSRPDGMGDGARPTSITQDEWVRYGFASCLQDNGYFASAGNDYSSEAWIDEKDYNFGYPVVGGGAQGWDTINMSPNYDNSSSGYNDYNNTGWYLREYQHGIAIVRPQETSSNGTLNLPEPGAGYRWQTFSGSNTGSVSISKRRGIILKRVAI